jgi:signal transduction histidine kinase
LRDHPGLAQPDIKRIYAATKRAAEIGDGFEPTLTGLGLSMSHDIVVKQHGGKLDVDTKPDTFTEFIITSPRTRAEQR